MENTKTIKLPYSEKEIEIVSYIEAGVILDLPKQEDRTKFLIENLVISIDGDKEDIYKKVRKLRYKDYSILDKAIAEVMSSEEVIEDTKKK